MTWQLGCEDIGPALALLGVFIDAFDDPDADCSAQPGEICRPGGGRSGSACARDPDLLPAGEAVVPSGAVGAGVYHVSFDLDPVVDVGGGARFNVTKRLMVRPDARALIVLADGEAHTVGVRRARRLSLLSRELSEASQ